MYTAHQAFTVAKDDAKVLRYLDLAKYIERLRCIHCGLF